MFKEMMRLIGRKKSMDFEVEGLRPRAGHKKLGMKS